MQIHLLYKLLLVKINTRLSSLSVGHFWAIDLVMLSALPGRRVDGDICLHWWSGTEKEWVWRVRVKEIWGGIREMDRPFGVGPDVRIFAFHMHLTRCCCCVGRAGQSGGDDGPFCRRWPAALSSHPSLCTKSPWKKCQWRHGCRQSVD